MVAGNDDGSAEESDVLLRAGTGDGVVDNSIVAGNDVDDGVALLRTGMEDGFIDAPMVTGKDVDDVTDSGFLGIS